MSRAFLLRPAPLVLAFGLFSGTVLAQETAGEHPSEDEPVAETAGPVAPAEVGTRLSPGLLPALFAVVPGIALHGSGVFAIGDTDTALKLLTVEGIGLFGMVAGTAVLAWTGATRRFTGVTSSIMIFGTGMFLTSMIADLYGAITGGTDAGPSLEAPRISLFLGHRYVHDVQFEYRNLARLEARLGLDRWQLGATGWIALDDNNQRARLSTAYRPYGPITSEISATDGSFISVEVAGTYHGYETEGFRTLTAEAVISGRYDLARFGRSLRGSFAEAEIGWGLEFYGYDVDGLTFGEDTSDMLLAGFAWGFYLGEAAASHGEIALYYDHRRDDYPGGALNGFAGHFGIEGNWIFCPDENGDAWGVRTELEIGTAFFGGVDLFYQWEAR